MHEPHFSCVSFSAAESILLKNKRCLEIYKLKMQILEEVSLVFTFKDKNNSRKRYWKTL